MGSLVDQAGLSETIARLAKQYRLAVDGGDQGLAIENRKALELLSEGQAALAKAAIVTAFVSDSDA